MRVDWYGTNPSRLWSLSSDLVPLDYLGYVWPYKNGFTARYFKIRPFPIQFFQTEQEARDWLITTARMLA